MIELSDMQRQIVLAMLAQMALAGVLLLMLPAPRVLAIRARKVTRDDHGRPIFPKWATQVSDCLNNQFQLPVLFYALCLLTLWLRIETTSLVWLAWGFVGLRWAHAGIFVTTNFIPLRFGLFLVSTLLVLSMLLQVSRRMLGV
jgi:hypothetical protein